MPSNNIEERTASSSPRGSSGSGRSGGGSTGGRSRTGDNSSGSRRPYGYVDPIDYQSNWSDILGQSWQDIDVDNLDQYGDDLSQIVAYLLRNSRDSDARNALGQLLFQYLVGEQNYSRNKSESELAYSRGLASNQVSQMMAAGMSRAAALSALQANDYDPASSDGSISPIGTNQEQNRATRLNSIMNAIQGATQVANQLVSLASAPFDLNAKRITNSMLTNQDNLLQMQVQGMQDAAMFTQAVANVDSSGGSKISSLPLMEQYAYFQQQSKMKPSDSGFEPNAFFFGNSQPFARAASNPFFWATLQETQRNRNYADASVFEPAKAQQMISQVRAASVLAANQAYTERMRGKILFYDGFIAECTASARRDMEMLKNQCEANNYLFNSERSKQFLDRLDQFGEFDFQQLDYEIERLKNINDAEIWQKQRDALVSSLDFQVANYIYGYSLQSMKSGVLQGLLPRDDNGNIDYSSNADILRWTKNYLRYSELGQSDAVNAGTSIARTIFSGITSAAAASFAGWKIFSGFKPASSAVNVVNSLNVSSSASVAAPMPFNTVMPIVASPALLELSNPLYGQQNNLIY